MENITEEYLLLFSAISACIEELNEMSQHLILIQQKAEELYISGSNESAGRQEG